MSTTPSSRTRRWTGGFAALAFASFLTAAGCDSTTPLTGPTGSGGAGGAAPSGTGSAAGAPATGGPVTDPGAGGAPAGLQANGSITYVRSK
jgi:hypothetical protein